MKSEAGEHTELPTHSITVLCIAIKPPSHILPLAGHEQQKKREYIWYPKQSFFDI